MRATILVDNLPARGLEAEWGLAVFIQYRITVHDTRSINSGNRKNRRL